MDDTIPCITTACVSGGDSDCGQYRKANQSAEPLQNQPRLQVDSSSECIIPKAIHFNAILKVQTGITIHYAQQLSSDYK